MMMPFLPIAIIGSLLVLLFVLRPLWKQSRALVIALAGSGVFIALALYWLLGTPLALDPALRRAPVTLDEAAAQLQARLALDPQHRDLLHTRVEGGRYVAVLSVPANAVVAESRG